jgi:hypothetical protein
MRSTAAILLCCLLAAGCVSTDQCPIRATTELQNMSSVPIRVTVSEPKSIPGAHDQTYELILLDNSKVQIVVWHLPGTPAWRIILRAQSGLQITSLQGPIQPEPSDDSYQCYSLTVDENGVVQIHHESPSSSPRPVDEASKVAAENNSSLR